ncbi:hypothetical protein K493DRAFT_298266 [Basidiobolus meristosporus CBS 931.73]|uniref:Uncharacterized protein n=1 Tax=Basidiobolus meristosporus CBS 931.73 TaxID=1314790 RepID=A0A1Y1YVG0_9FUNG|nr:hypothetical protein K493DRAFT_298266 [Basidiobolus meristosporus CBS 931.73]|eukprot:ORY01717.1 hypothetical protein K493DRAFT_298266 [Basidiobolus meristosporus CBS 931.73]
MLDTAHLLSYLSTPTDLTDSPWLDMGLGLGKLKKGLPAPTRKYTSSLKDTQARQAYPQNAFTPVRIPSQKRLTSERRNNTSLCARPLGPYTSSSPNTEANTRSKLPFIPISPNSTHLHPDTLISPTREKGGFSPPRSVDRDIPDPPQQFETRPLGLGSVGIYAEDMEGCSDVELNSDDSFPSTPSGSPSITPQPQTRDCFTLHELVDRAATHPLGRSSIERDSSEAEEITEELEFGGNDDWIDSFMLKTHRISNALHSTPSRSPMPASTSLGQMNCTASPSQPIPIADYSPAMAQLPAKATKDRLIEERLLRISISQTGSNTRSTAVARCPSRMTVPPLAKGDAHLNGNMTFDSGKMCWINLEESLDDPFADFSDDEESLPEPTQFSLDEEFRLTPDELSGMLIKEMDHKSTMQQWVGVDYSPVGLLEARELLE